MTRKSTKFVSPLGNTVEYSQASGQWRIAFRSYILDRIMFMPAPTREIGMEELDALERMPAEANAREKAIARMLSIA